MSEEILKGKDLIINEASKLFIQKGYHEVSIRDIAKACEMTNAAIYYHFEDKESLFFEVVDNFNNELAKYFKEIYLLTIPPKEKIKKMLIVFLNFSLRAETSFTRVMHDFHGLMKEKYGRKGKFFHSPSGQNILRYMNDCFEQAVIRGEIESMEEPFTHPSLLMALNRGFITTLIHSSDFEFRDDFLVEELAEKILNIYWHGIEIKK